MGCGSGAIHRPMRALRRVAGTASGSYVWKAMARPIEATPVLEGEDAERLLRDLERTCTPEEAKRRVQKARELLAKVMVPPSDDIAAE
jgi:hypothetical protein